MVESLTIVFNSYYGEKSIKKALKYLKKFKIIIIENSLDKRIKETIEKKYKNAKVIIPKENLGLAKGYNLGIKLAKTKFVFLNNPDIIIKYKTILKLLNLAKNIKDFGIIAPTYDNEKIFKNYTSFKKLSDKNILNEVNFIDNNFLINKSYIKKKLFDENFFLYFETTDFCLNLRRNGKKLFVSKKLKFKHFHSSSTDNKYANIVKLTRAWHYNWSKFYYFKKNYNYIYALLKIFPNFYQALRNLIQNLIKSNTFDARLNFIEIFGIISSVIGLKSFYRAKK